MSLSCAAGLATRLPDTAALNAVKARRDRNVRRCYGVTAPVRSRDAIIAGSTIGVPRGHVRRRLSNRAVTAASSMIGTGTLGSTRDAGVGTQLVVGSKRTRASDRSRATRSSSVHITTCARWLCASVRAASAATPTATAALAAARISSVSTLLDPTAGDAERFLDLEVGRHLTCGRVCHIVDRWATAQSTRGSTISIQRPR
jgi:hypothetical protein